MSEFRHGRRRTGFAATKTRIVTMSDGERSIVIDEAEPIYIDCHGDCDLNYGACECDEKGCCQ